MFTMNRKNNTRRQAGFTLIEILVALVVLAILGGLAVAAYSDVLVKAQVKEGMDLTATARTEVVEHFNRTGAFPSSTQLAPSASGKYVSSIGQNDGTITITYGNGANSAIATQTLAMRPAANGLGNVQWFCGNATVNTAAFAAVGAAGTTSVPDRFLPGVCKTGN